PVPLKADPSRRKPGARNDNSCAIFHRERRSAHTGRNELPRAKSLQNATLYMPSKCYVAFVNTKACQAPQRCICHPNALKTLTEFFEKQSEGKPLKCDIMYLVESEKARCLFRLFLFFGLVWLGSCRQYRWDESRSFSAPSSRGRGRAADLDSSSRVELTRDGGEPATGDAPSSRVPVKPQNKTGWPSAHSPTAIFEN